MKKNLFLVLAVAAATMTVSCNKNLPTRGDVAKIAIEPIITRATETDFEQGDKIGLTILQGQTAYVENECMTYDGSRFTSELCWYTEGEQTSTFVAYYPYAETVPASFSIAADQKENAPYAAADLMCAVKTGVEPQATITMPFKHMMTRIVVDVDNTVNANITSLLLKNAVMDAAVDFEQQTVAPAEGATAKDVTPHVLTANKKYVAIVVPQTVAFQLFMQVEGGKKTITKTLNETTLKQGGQYTIKVQVLADDIMVALSGEIQNWSNEGEILEDGEAPEIVFVEYDDYFEYYGETYKTVTLADGNKWMAENMRYVPEGLTPCSDLTNVAAGVYYPVKVVGGDATVAGTASFDTDPEAVKAKGYLYQSEVALGLAVNGITNEDQAKSLEGTQGICPQGWHIPTIADMTGLVGKAVSPIVTNTAAPYYNGSNGSIKLLNDAGFNVRACGAVTVQNNTATAATLMGAFKGYPDKVTTGYICGSSYKASSISYNTTGDVESGIKNLQFYGFMPMENKPNEADYTCNGSGLSYKIAASVRCVKNK